MTSVGSGRTRRPWGRRIALSLTTILASGLAAPAIAQTDPAYRNLDKNGVDLTQGDFVLNFPEGSIGSGEGELTLVRQYNTIRPLQWDGYSYTKKISGGVTTVLIGLPGHYVDTFVNGVSTKNNGATLSGYTYRAADGTKIEFVSLGFEENGPTNFCTYPYMTSVCDMVPGTITRPTGSSITFAYDSYKYPGPTSGTQNLAWRISSISNSRGYEVAFAYASGGLGGGGGGGTPPPTSWSTRTSAKFYNTAVSATTVQGTIGYAYPAADTTDITDMAGNSWRVTSASIRRPGESSPSFAVTGGSVSAVTAVTRDGVSTSYSRVVSGTTATMTVTDALSHSTVIVSDLSKGRPTSVTDAAGKTTNYTLDTYGRVTRVTNPEGNYVNYTYDGRGNVTETRQVAKSGSGLSDIVSTASYDTSCSNPVKCNQPNSVTDPRGNTTNYSYDATHGGVTAITAPAPSGSGTRPETRYSYTLTNGEYLITGVSACQTGAAPACVGTADEIKTTMVYDASGNVTSVTQAAGNNSLSATATATYTPMGDVLTVDGPLSGTADTTTLRYDAARRRVGVISADPDGAGSLKRRAQKTTYDTAGRVTDIEAGTVAGTTDTDWTAFASAQKVTTTWTSGRKSRDVLTSGSNTYQVTDYSYDAVGRPQCTALRMNSAVWGSAYAACSLNTTGSYGPDRITKTSYDAVGRVNLVQTGYGVTGVQADDVTTAYTDNGQTASVTDAEGNRTSYTYDGFDRLSRTSYPSTTKGAGTSSSSDYEELVYDAASNVTSRRLRGYASDSTKHIDFTYDALNRVTAKDLPNSEPDVAYSYDLLGRITQASRTADGVNHYFAYDALGRLTSETQPFGSASYQYDAAGRRTRLTWNDGFYVGYDYLVTGEVSAIRENGATSGIGVLASYAYDDLGRRTSLTYGNGTVTTYGFDAVSRLSSLSHNLDGATTTNDVATTFGYSPADAIATQTRTNDLYAWGDHHNVARGYTSNGLNQLTASGATALGYDARGNLTSSGSDSFTYSSENLLKSAPSASLYYDALLRLVEYDTSVSTRMLYDGDHLIAEVSNPGGTVAKRYVFGPGADAPLVEYAGSGTGSGVRTFLHADERGSIVARSNESGAKTAILSYDEYGIPNSGSTGRFQYTGQAWLPEVGVYYYKARMYSPSLGRFMQTDPIGYGDGMNWYAYVHNDPVNGSDSFGLGDCGPGEYPVAVASAEDSGPDIIVRGPRTLCMALPGFGGGGAPAPYFGGGGDGGGAPDPQPAVSDNAEIVVQGRPKKTGTPHKYVIGPLLSPCPANVVFDYFKQAGNSAPGAPAAKEGFTPRRVLTFDNPISQSVNSSTRTIVNTALPGHRYFPGSVTIQVSPVVYNGVTSTHTSTITVTGVGTGPNAEENVITGTAWFGAKAAMAQDICGK